ncbi:MAG: (2Fe-2S)-binding protein [Planctomycetaceae bacterium]|nr:(2Fe-2S)-binding protein [Planctomycetaceae bacterium]
MFRRVEIQSHGGGNARQTMYEDAICCEDVICHCLKVTQAEVESAIVTSDDPSLRCVMRMTGAGTGCTACHQAIRNLVRAQCPPAASSPTCVMR